MQNTKISQFAQLPDYVTRWNIVTAITLSIPWGLAFLRVFIFINSIKTFNTTESKGVVDHSPRWSLQCSNMEVQSIDWQQAQQQITGQILHWQVLVYFNWKYFKYFQPVFLLSFRLCVGWLWIKQLSWNLKLNKKVE